tara:strand:+ start:594 stop:959 length:366 start_codon:yes stop_codon:yes gene_type:complete
MQNILQLNSNAQQIDLNKIKKFIEIKQKYRHDQKKHFEEDQEVVYTILHQFSNYDEVIWSLYKTNNRKSIHYQLKFVLVEISKLDPSLTWACMKIFKRYKNQYDQRKHRNSFVKTTSLALG